MRPDEIIRAMAEALLFLFLISPPLALLEYPLQALNYPLRDAEFAAIDRMMGFDWLAHVTWVSEHPFAGTGLRLAYHSCMIQMALVIVALSYTRQFDRLREFLMLFILTAIAVTLIAAVIPAEGAFAFYKPPASIRIGNDPLAGIYHLEHVRALRAGTLKSIGLDHIFGLVTLPSFHVIFAILLAWATRGLRFVFIPAVIFNTVVSISAIAIGGHYLIDVVTGAAMAFAAIYLYHTGTALAGLLNTPAVATQPMPTAR
jgi:membrane-associated phospholipid phosphatase